MIESPVSLRRAVRLKQENALHMREEADYEKILTCLLKGFYNSLGLVELRKKGMGMPKINLQSAEPFQVYMRKVSLKNPMTRKLLAALEVLLCSEVSVSVYGIIQP